VFVWLTRIGTDGLVWIALAAGVALAWRRFAPFVLTALAVALADGLTELVKLAVGEHRPTGTHPLVAMPSSDSFPSGHTSTAFAAATVLARLEPRSAPGLFLLAAAIGYSRLYVGVHFPLDIAGGAVLGVATALLLLAAARRRSVRLRR
jgi:membrane-associated phospholipid phosphatase